MPKYKGYATVRFYREFEFEAEDEELAWDHLEHLADHRGPSYIINEWTESGPDDVYLEGIDEL